MEDTIPIQKRVISPIVFDFKTISQVIQKGKVDIQTTIFLFLNIGAVGFAASQRTGSASIFFPGLDKSISVFTALVIGIIFQIGAIVTYAYLQTFFLELFSSKLSFERALIMIAHAGLWFVPAILLIDFNIFLGLAFAIISFISVVLIMHEYMDTEFSSAVAAVGISSLITGLISVTLSQLIILVV